MANYLYYALLLITAYFLGVVVLGIFVLRVISAAHVTVANILIFVLGATAGTLFLSLCDFLYLKDHIPVHYRGLEILMVTFLGSAGGGAALTLFGLHGSRLGKRAR